MALVPTLFEAGDQIGFRLEGLTRSWPAMPELVARWSSTRYLIVGAVPDGWLCSPGRRTPSLLGRRAR